MVGGLKRYDEFDWVLGAEIKATQYKVITLPIDPDWLWKRK